MILSRWFSWRFWLRTELSTRERNPEVVGDKGKEGEAGPTSEDASMWRRTSMRRRWRRNSQGERRKQDSPGREYPMVLKAKESEDPGKFRYVGDVEIHGNRGGCYLWSVITTC